MEKQMKNVDELNRLYTMLLELKATSVLPEANIPEFPDNTIHDILIDNLIRYNTQTITKTLYYKYGKKNMDDDIWNVINACKILTTQFDAKIGKFVVKESYKVVYNVFNHFTDNYYYYTTKIFDYKIPSEIYDQLDNGIIDNTAIDSIINATSMYYSKTEMSKTPLHCNSIRF